MLPATRDACALVFSPPTPISFRVPPLLAATVPAAGVPVPMRVVLPRAIASNADLVVRTASPVSQAPAVKPAHAPGTIALIQYDGDAHFGDYEHNLQRLTALAEEAVAKGAKIIVTPEGALYGYASKDELWCRPGMTKYGGRKCRDVSNVAESIERGRTAEYWTKFSRKHGVYVLFNIPENDGTAFYNTTGVAGPKGLTASYRKRMLYKTDQAYATAGSEPTVLQTEYGSFGLLTCLDAYPKSPYFEEYKALGAEALIISMNWDDDPSGDYAAKLKFREWALLHRIDIYASDSAPWDGSAKYLSTGEERQRGGLPRDAVDVEGVSLHRFQY